MRSRFSLVWAILLLVLLVLSVDCGSARVDPRPGDELITISLSSSSTSSSGGATRIKAKGRGGTVSLTATGELSGLVGNSDQYKQCQMQKSHFDAILANPNAWVVHFRPDGTVDIKTRIAEPPDPVFELKERFDRQFDRYHTALYPAESQDAVLMKDVRKQMFVINKEILEEPDRDLSAGHVILKYLVAGAALVHGVTAIPSRVKDYPHYSKKATDQLSLALRTIESLRAVKRGEKTVARLGTNGRAVSVEEARRALTWVNESQHEERIHFYLAWAFALDDAHEEQAAFHLATLREAGLIQEFGGNSNPWLRRLLKEGQQ